MSVWLGVVASQGAGGGEAHLSDRPRGQHRVGHRAVRQNLRGAANVRAL